MCTACCVRVWEVMRRLLHCPRTSTEPVAAQEQKASSSPNATTFDTAAATVPLPLKGGEPLSTWRVTTQAVGAPATNSRITTAGHSRQHCQLSGLRCRQRMVARVAAAQLSINTRSYGLRLAHERSRPAAIAPCQGGGCREAKRHGWAVAGVGRRGSRRVDNCKGGAFAWPGF